MRKLMRKRHFHLPRIAAMFLLALSIVFHPDAGMGGTESQPKTHTTLSDQTVIKPAEKSAEAQTAAEKIRSQILRIAQDNAATKAKMEKRREEARSAKYDQSIYSALKHQGLTEEDLAKWRHDHPLSTLNRLDKLPPAKQRSVANTATFIRKVNSKIPHETAWREASALVFYSIKYGVPSNLAIGIAKAESHFNPNAKSSAGALGVMQVMWKVHNGMLRAKGIAPTRDHMFDPERGVEAGVLILSRYITAYGTVQKALNKYYGGIATNYLKKVNKNMAQLKSHSEAMGY